MSDALEQYRKECEEMKLAGMVWWMILWYASDEGRLELPSQHEWLSCELSAAIIEEVTQATHHYSWRHDIHGKECHQDPNWEDELNGFMYLCEQVYPDRFDGVIFENKIRNLLRQFAHYTIQFHHDEAGYVSELKWFHEGYTPRALGRSRFVPTREMYMQGIDELLRYTSAHHAEVCQWCRKLGMLMRPYIERDVAYIKMHYSW